VAGGVAAAAVVAALLIWLVPTGGGTGGPAAAPPGGGGRTAAAAEPGGSGVPTDRADPAGGPVRGGGSTTRQSGQNANRPGVVPPNGSAAPGPTVTGAAVPPPSSSPTPAPANGTSLSSKGGTVTAVCDGSRAHLTSVEPKPDYRVQKANVGPALTTSVVFKNKAQRVQMTVTCVAGAPALVTLGL
jgi:serine/threonine-protein kinase